MITLSRAMAKRLVSLLGKTLNLPRPLLKRQAVKFLVDKNGLTVESATATHAIRYRDPRNCGLPQSWEVPLESIQALAKSAAKQGELSLQGEAEVRLHLLEKTIPRDEGFSAPELVLETPASPEVGYLLALTVRPALIAAFETAEQGDPGRYALNCVQLQGSKAALAATDGRQLLIQKGLHWPFEEDLLLGNYCKLFRCGDFPEGPIEVCKTERQLVFRVGDWEFFLPIEEQRYPKVEDVVPAPEEAVAHLEISSGDAVYLEEKLPHLPFDPLDGERSVTIELNGKIGVRARSIKIPAGVELILRNSQRSGVDLLCAMQRRYLQRALELGLRRFQFFQNGCAPVVVRDGQTTFCWATYHPDGVAQGTPDTELRESPLEANQQEYPRSFQGSLRAMPSLIRVGLRQRKSFRVGAISASRELEVELPPELLSGAGAPLQRRAEIAFDACREAVHSELARYESDRSMRVRQFLKRTKPMPSANGATGRAGVMQTRKRQSL